jgi:hypothetical protein
LFPVSLSDRKQACSRFLRNVHGWFRFSYLITAAAGWIRSVCLPLSSLTFPISVSSKTGFSGFVFLQEWAFDLLWAQLISSSVNASSPGTKSDPKVQFPLFSFSSHRVRIMSLYCSLFELRNPLLEVPLVVPICFACMPTTCDDCEASRGLVARAYEPFDPLWPLCLFASQCFCPSSSIIEHCIYLSLLLHPLTSAVSC